MKHYLVGSSVIFSHLQGNVAATEFLAREKDLVVSYVTYKKLLKAAESKEDVKAVKDLMNAFTIHWGSPDTNRLTIELYEQHRKAHDLDFASATQAAIAITSDLILATTKKKKYKHIPKLKTTNI